MGGRDESIHGHRFDRHAVVPEPPSDRPVYAVPHPPPPRSFLECHPQAGIGVEARAHGGRCELREGRTAPRTGRGRGRIPTREDSSAQRREHSHAVPGDPFRDVLHRIVLDEIPDPVAFTLIGLPRRLVARGGGVLVVHDRSRRKPCLPTRETSPPGEVQVLVVRDEIPIEKAHALEERSAGAALYRRTLFERVGLFDRDFVAYYEDLDLAWRARLAGWEARFAPRAVVYHKYSASSSYQSAWKTYQGERNRIWNLVQNYPMQYVAEGIPWNGMRVLAALRRRILPGRYTSPPTTGAGRGPSFAEFASATVRARLDAYAGLGMAFQKRRMRRADRHVDKPTIGRGLPHYGVPIKSMPRDLLVPPSYPPPPGRHGEAGGAVGGAIPPAPWVTAEAS